MPDLISKDDALTLLGPHLDDIRDCLRSGWAVWRTVCNAFPEMTPQLRRATRANFVYDAVVIEAKKRFDTKTEVSITEARGFLTLTFGNRIVLRFKKFSGRTLRTMGVMTDQRRAFESQLLAPALPGMEVTTVVAGYLLDGLELDLHLTAVTCSIDGQIIWDIELDPAVSEVGSVVSMPSQSQAPAVAVRSRLVDEAKEERA